jgi:hypothetical protein
LAYSEDSHRKQSSSQSEDEISSDEASSVARAISRRDIGKLALATSGVLALDAMLPAEWITPLVQVGFLPAHAVGTMPGGGFMINVKELPKGVRGSTQGGASGMGGMDGSSGIGGNGGTGGMGGSGGAGGDGSNTKPGDTRTGTNGADSQPDSSGSNGVPVTCNPPPTTPQPDPSGAVASNITATSATLKWNANGGRDFSVQILGAGATVTKTITGAGMVLQDLKPCTSYSVYVYSNLCNKPGSVAAFTSFVTTPDFTIKPAQPVLDQQDCYRADIKLQALPCNLLYEAEIIEEDTGIVRSAQFSYYQVITLYNLCPGKSYRVHVRGVESYYPNARGTNWSSDLTITQPTIYRGKMCDPCSSYSSSSSEG